MGLFDDVLEPPKPARKGGLFDDVLSAPAAEPETGLFDALTKRLGAGVSSKIGGGLRFLGETLSPDVRGLSPNVAALADVLLPQRLAGQELTGAGTQAVDYASGLRQEAGGVRPASIMDALTDPTNTAKYYGGTLVESLPELVAGIATRNPAAANAIIAGATGAGEYGSARQQGTSQFDATQQAGTNALVEAALGKTPLETAFGAAPFLRRAATASAQEAGTEALTQVGQDILPRAQRGEDIDLGQVLTNAIDAAIIGSATGPIEALGGRARAPEPVQPALAPQPRPFVDAPRGTEIAPTPAPPVPVVAPEVRTDGQAEDQARAVPEAPQAPEGADPDTFTAKTKGGTFRLRDVEAPAGTDFSEFGQVRQVTAFDGDTPIGTLTYANDGTPPTIEVNPEYQRRGVASAMLRLAEQRGGVLGDAVTGIRGRGAEYRTPAGQAFREGAQQAEVELTPFQAEVTPVADTAPVAEAEPIRDQAAPVQDAGNLQTELDQRGIDLPTTDNKGTREALGIGTKSAPELGEPVRIEGDDPKTVTYRHREDGLLERTVVYDDGEKIVSILVTDKDGNDVWQNRNATGKAAIDSTPVVLSGEQASGWMRSDLESLGQPAPTFYQDAIPEADEEPVVAAPPVRATGIANAEVAARREAEGRAPLIQEARRTNRETIDTAVEKTAANPRLAAETVAKLNSGQAATLDDEAVLFVDAVNLRKQRDSALDTINDPDATEYAKEVAQREYAETEAKIEANEQASKAVGTESGRLLQLRRRLLADDFSLQAMERRVRAAQNKPLTQEQTQHVRDLSKKIEELTTRAEKAEAQVSQAGSVATYEDLLKSMQAALKGPRKRPTLDKLREAANESRAALAGLQGVPSRKGQSGAAINPVAFYHLARIGAYHIANGAASLSDFTARMRADIGAKLDEFRDMLPAVFQAAKEQAKVSGSGPSVDAVLAKVDGAPTPKHVRDLAEAHIRAGLRGEGPVLEAVASSLGIPVAEVRQLFVATTPRGPRTLSEAKAELARLRKEVRDSMRPDAETRYQETRGKGIRKRIADLEARIAAGDFAKAPPRVQRQLNRANEQAQLELDKAKQEFERLRLEAEFAARTPIKKVLGHSRDAINLARALMTSLDFSGLLRQGGFISFGHPVRAARAVPQALRAFGSERAELAARQEIEKRPNARLYKQAGLELTDIGAGSLKKVEEAFASRLLQKVPRVLGGGLIRGSGRSYTTLLNRLRADSFDAMVAGLSRTEKPSAAEAKAIANYINVATGRGKVGLSENVGETLNTLFFAPRLVASRFQLLAWQPLYGGTNRTRSLVAQDYARFLMGVGVTLAVASMMKDEDDETPFLSLDPRSADFGKARFGNTFLDPLAGLAQVSTFVWRLATGETKTGAGVVRPIRPDWTLTDLRRALGEDLPAHKLTKEGGLPFGSSDSFDVIARFLRTKLAPVPGALINTASGSDLIGKPTSPGQTLASLVTPMSFNDVGKVMEEQGVPRGSAIWLLSLLGMGMQHREPKKPKEGEKAKEPAESPRASMVPSSRKADYTGFNENSQPQVAPEVLKGARNAPRMTIVGDWSGLPENVRDRFDNGALGVFDPGTKNVYIANGLGEKESKLTAYHEIAGHYGLQGALGNDYEAVLNRARQNPTVDKLSDAMGERAYTDVPNKLARTEEALSELAAALRADDYDTIEERWGVKIPASARPGVRGMLGRVVQMTKRKLSDLIGDEPQAFDDDQVHSLIEDAWQYVERGDGK